MKHTFKYSSGHINIDDENLYLTSSGNWEEAQTLTQKNAASIAANKRRVKRNSLLLYIPMAIIILSPAVLVGADKLKFAPLMLLYFLIYYLYKHFSKQLGNRYKIPISKIEAIVPVDGCLKIIFRNEDGQPDFEVVKGVEDKGVVVLRSLLS